jgi:protein-tyrosine phosphatase
MRCLLIYYSFTGQAQRAVEAAAREIGGAGSEAVTCRIDFAAEEARLRRPLSLVDIKRWTTAASRGDRLPIRYEPPGCLEGSYDLVFVFSNTWQKSPATPIRSFLESPDAARVLSGRPFAVVVVCRRLWENNLAVVRRLGEAAGGSYVDALAVIHNGGNAGSLVQTTTYMMGSGTGRRHLLGVPLPEYGLSPESLDKIAPFTRRVLERVDEHAGRVVQLEGGHNFRDLGGYIATDGRRVRTGLVFRSGTLAELTEPDLEQVARLGIKFVCDFRANRERTARPSRWPASATIDLWTRDHESSVGELVHAVRAPGATADEIRGRMRESYRTLPYEQAESFRELFNRVASGSLPLMFHCSAGKDRTGCAAALLLSLLGVARDTVIEDYMLSERFFESCCRIVRNDPTSARLTAVDSRIWEPLLRAERSYIETMFQVLEQRHGSVEGYLHDVLGVSADVGAAIRGRLLE